MVQKLKSKFSSKAQHSFKILLTFFALIITSQNAIAGATATIYTWSKTSETETTAYAGLVWTLGKEFKKTPKLTLGIRAIKKETPLTIVEVTTFETSGGTALLSDGKPSTKIKGGLDFSARINFDNTMKVESTRLLYVNGNKDLLGNLGIGYSFVNDRPFGTLGIQAEYSRIGMDVALDNSMLASPQFFAELLTLGKIDEINPDCSTSILDATCVAVGELLE
jgi:hypothetical protein